MPMYSYRCNSCGHEFSMQLKVNNRGVPTEQECPNCDALDDIVMIIGTPLVSYSTNPGMNVSDNFTDRLKQIRNRSGADNTIHTKR